MRNMQDESNQRLIMIVDDDQALGEMLSIVYWRAKDLKP